METKLVLQVLSSLESFHEYGSNTLGNQNLLCFSNFKLIKKQILLIWNASHE